MAKDREAQNREASAWVNEVKGGRRKSKGQQMRVGMRAGDEANRRHSRYI